jgi:Family of unknown function (DUF6728)
MSEEKNEDQKDEKLTTKEFFGMGELLGYFFRKKDPTRPKNFNLKMMHGVNKISIIMFLIALIVMIVRLISRS